MDASITVSELVHLLQGGTPPQVIDVRREADYAARRQQPSLAACAVSQIR